MRSEYINIVTDLKKRFKVFKETKDWLGHPITVFEVGGERDKPILITAGAHGDEPAGFYATLEIMIKLRSEHRTYIVPARDPTGIHSLEYVLQKMFDIEQCFSLECLKTLIKREGEVLLDTNNIFLGLVGHVGFAFKIPDNPWEGVRPTISFLKEIIKKNERIRDKLYGSRILIPALLPRAEGVGMTGRMYTVFIGDDVFNYNTFSPSIDFPEISWMQRTIDEIKPWLTIDLHEGFGDGFYTFVTDKTSEIEKSLLEVVLDQLKEHALPPLSIEKMKKFMGKIEGREFVDDGIVKIATENFAKTLAGYSSKYCPSFIFETGLRAPLQKRIDSHVIASLALINAATFIPLLN